MSKISTINGKAPHQWVESYIQNFRDGNLDRREFLTALGALGVTSASALALAGMVPSSAQANLSEAKKGGVVRYSQEVMALKNAPWYNEWSQMGNAFRPILETLVVLNADGSYSPGLAESWQYSPDGKQLTLTLRKGVKWHNGDEFNADDVMNTLNGWLNSLPKSTMQSRFPGLLEEYDTGDKDEEGKNIMVHRAREGAVEKLDSHIVRLNSSMSDISFVASIADYSAFIVHRSHAKGDDWLKNPIGTGAFELVEYLVGDRAIYKARDDYWGEGPFVDQVVFIDLKANPATEYAAFSSGQIDVNYDTGPDQIEKLSKISSIQLNGKETANTGILRFNLDADKRFQNKKLRQAITLGVDNNKVLEIAYKGYGTIGENHHVSPLHPAYAKLPYQKRDVEKAKALLAEAGYPDGIDIEAVAVDSPTWESEVVLAVADQLKDIGVRVKVNILPGSAYWEKWQQWPFSLTGWNARPLAVQCLNLAYKTGAVWNETAYANSEFDKLCEQASAEPNVDKRRVIVKKIEQTLQDDAIFLQPLWRGRYNFSSKKLKNYTIHPSFENDFKHVWFE